LDILQENFVQTKTQDNHFKSKEAPEREKTHSNQAETSKKKVIAN